MGKENRSIIINGVGSILTVGANGKVAPIGSLQSLRFDFAVTEDPVYGGDGLFPIDYVTRDKNVAITATNAKFDLNLVRLATGATIGAPDDEDAYIWVLNKVGTVKKTGTSGSYKYVVDIFEDGTPFSNPEFTVMDMATGEVLELDDDADEGKFAVVEAKTTNEGTTVVTGRTLEFDSDMEGKMVMYSFKKAASDMSIAEGKTNDLPIPIKIIHQGNFKQKDDTWQGIETEIKMAKAVVLLSTMQGNSKCSVIDIICLTRRWYLRLYMKRFVTTAPHVCNIVQFPPVI